MAKPAAVAAVILCAGVLVWGLEERRVNAPLHLAAVANKIDETKRLLASGANVNALGEYDWTPLILAANNGHCPVMVSAEDY